MGKGTVTSDEHVDVKLLNGTLTADRLRITDGGEVVRFEGNVVMNLIMDSPLAPQSRPANGQRPRLRTLPRRQRRDRLRQIRQPEMISMMTISPRSTFGRRIAHGACMRCASRSR